MHKHVVIIDYGVGNLRSLKVALGLATNHEIIVSSDHDTILNADYIILPGVGSFQKAMSNLDNLDLVKIIRIAVLENKIPILGICLGMQLLGQSSTEGGVNAGLRLYNGTVDRFKNCTLKIPHVGFNQVYSENENTILLKSFETLPDFYFTHSYKMLSLGSNKVGYTIYDEKFTSLIEVDNIYGTQFHPELSQKNGLKLLQNFINHSC